MSESKPSKTWMWAFALWGAVGTIVVLGVWSYQTGGLCYDLFGDELTAEQRIERLREFFAALGFFAPMAYVFFVMVEVIVAPIPGLMLYAPGGLLFGPWFGGTLAVIGNTLGAGVSCLLARSLGDRWIARFFDADSVARVQERLEKRGALLIFLLRLNPLTSSDLLSYAAGFTRISVGQVMLATGLGMVPLCYAQSWLSDSLFHRFPKLVYPLLIASLVYLVVVVVVFRRMMKRREN